MLQWGHEDTLSDNILVCVIFLLNLLLSKEGRTQGEIEEKELWEDRWMERLVF
jgi:hypothetical protein